MIDNDYVGDMLVITSGRLSGMSRRIISSKADGTISVSATRYIKLKLLKFSTLKLIFTHPKLFWIQWRKGIPLTVGIPFPEIPDEGDSFVIIKNEAKV